HIGTAERLGKVTILGKKQHVGPKEVASCQISLSEPVLALRGDRFIVRDETAQRILGGGAVLHPWPTRHRRVEPDLEQRIHELQNDEPGSLVRTFLEGCPDFAVSMAALYQFLNVDEPEARRQVGAASGVRTLALEGETLYTTDDKWGHLGSALAAALREFHAAHPLLLGMEMEALRNRLADQLAPRLFRACIEQLVAAGVVSREGNLLRLPEHHVQLQDEEQDVVVRVR